ncbi:hypothetical protein [Micromonospora robiginosa]|uniref:Uncharacterized protein n=1 Tax=Micromonospora robiginosa TaxID=2749844 RepID=A0A7L6B7S0_9ACTN|nr:hypothetical protein [Micromonospora ferruginea]QLQ38016.1 hypothetical protein H1D33_03735 [Micromonospora ferruginea]
MQVSQALDIIEALLNAAEHPDIAAVERYGRDAQPGGQSPAGIRVQHRSSDTRALLMADVPPRTAQPVPVLTEPLPPKWRAARILVLVHQLLDAARPEQLAGWELVTQDGTHSPVAAGIRITARDRSVVYLRGIAASGQQREPENDPYPDYRIPQGVQSWHLSPSAPSAERASA